MDKSPQTEADINDQIRHLIAQDMAARMGHDIPPMIGDFTLISEYTDASDGVTKYVTLTSRNLAPWREMGFLNARLETIKGRWRESHLKGQGDN